MLFNSFEFLAFFLCLFVAYYMVPRKGWQLSVLISGSAIFYGWHKPELLLLLGLCVFFNTIVSRAISTIESQSTKVLIATLGVIANLSLLVVFKYSAFIVSLLDGALHNNLASGSFVNVLVHLPLPIGISFYSFESVCVLVDTLRGDQTLRSRSPAKLLRDTALFISFFPHLIAGPIVRPKQFFPQITDKRLKDIPWTYVCENLILGYFLKIFVADNLAEIHTSVFSLHSVCSGYTNLLAMLTYSIRLFSDYAGYSYIALGLSAALGYRLPLNFDWPFCSQSLSELWRRWNITLGAWLRDYLYIPLGGSQKGALRTCINLFVVMIVSGLWHGADTRFLIFGMVHGLALCVERLLGWNRPRPLSMPFALVSRLYVFVYFSLAALLIHMPVEQTIAFLQSIYKNWSNVTRPGFPELMLLYALPVIAMHIFAAVKDKPLFRADNAFFRLPPSLKVAPLLREGSLALMLFLIISNPGFPSAFVYFQF